MISCSHSPTVLTGDEEATATTGGAGDTSTDVDPQEGPGAYSEAVAAAMKKAGSYRMDVSLGGAVVAGQSDDMSGLVPYDGDDPLAGFSESQLRGTAFEIAVGWRIWR